MKKSPPMRLQSAPNSWRQVFWDDKGHIMNRFFEEGVDVQDEDVRHLIKELDRRFTQLWDKVNYERKLS